jgi:acyl-CoA thioesterase-1
MWMFLLACADPPAPPPPPVAAPAPVPRGPKVVFLGDSLTAGLGLPADQAFPALVGAALAAEGHPVQVVNAGVSGDTTAGGVRRLDWLLGQHPDVVVVGLGGNDMLRGQPPEEVARNLRDLVVRSRDAGAAVLLLGMRANPTLGPDYAAAFDAVYPALAAELSVPLVPFLLEGVVGDPALVQPDGLHPTAEGHARLADLVRPALAPLVTAAGAAPAGAPAPLPPPPTRP